MAPTLSTSFYTTAADVVDNDRIIGYSCKMIADVTEMYYT